MNDTDKLIHTTADYVRSRLQSDSSGHDWWHTFRVWRLAKHICVIENGDILVVELGALLHDIADYKLHGGDLKAGPEEAARWLTSQAAPKKVINAVKEIVEEISFKGGGVADAEISLEGRIVRDADRLDAIGAVGIARAFVFAGFKGEAIYDPDIKPRVHDSFEDYKNKNSTAINHFFEKLLLLKDRMHTETAKELARQRHEFLVEYLDKFFEEWNADAETTKGRQNL